MVGMRTHRARDPEITVHATQTVRETSFVYTVEILSRMESIQLMKTQHVEELCALETRLDVQHAGELAKLRADLTERLLSDLLANKEGLAADLQHEGLYVPPPDDKHAKCNSAR